MIKKVTAIKQRKNIKEKQMLELRKNKICLFFPCNMKIHDDGKSNIYYSSCFDVDKKTLFKDVKPTVGLLNPPFKPPKTNEEKEELEFVLNNLSMISPNGITVALLPMDCVNTQKEMG